MNRVFAATLAALMLGAGFGVAIAEENMNGAATTESESTAAVEMAKDAGEEVATEAVAGLETAKQKVSYTLGFQMISQLKDSGFEIDRAAFMRAIEDVYAEKEMTLSQEEVMEAMTAIQAEMEAEQAAAGEAARAAGEAFLAENAKREGVVTTESGLQYEMLKEGEGAQPKSTDIVTVNYHGTLVDGTVFDTTRDGEPATFPVGRVIKGWQEGIPMMKVGEAAKLYIPSDLAYGEQGRPGRIPPHSVLVFEVELLNIEPPPPPAPPGAGFGSLGGSNIRPANP